MLVINLFGGPCSGKSTFASRIFYELKKLHINVELVTEQAKSFTWSERHLDLQCQPYVFAKQLRDIWRLKDKVDVCVVDSPLLMSLAYTGKEWPESFRLYVVDQFNQFDNYNLFLLPNHDYSEVGRNQTYEESIELSKKIENLLVDKNVIYDIINVTANVNDDWFTSFREDLLQDIYLHLSKGIF